jgi:hypothetical protein
MRFKNAPVKKVPQKECSIIRNTLGNEEEEDDDDEGAEDDDE